VIPADRVMMGNGGALLSEDFHRDSLELFPLFQGFAQIAGSVGHAVKREAGCRTAQAHERKALRVMAQRQAVLLQLPFKIRAFDASLNPCAALEAGGRIKAPCLKVQQDDVSERRLYESDEIKAWLQERFEPA
jgi:hypothetical protein